MNATTNPTSSVQAAIVFVHGGGLSSRMWQPFIEDLRHSTSEAFNRTQIEALANQQLPEKLNGPLLALVGEKEEERR